jgi:hypothetical protein
MNAPDTIKEEVEGEEEQPLKKKKVTLENVGPVNSEGKLLLLDSEIRWIAKHFTGMHALR